MRNLLFSLESRNQQSSRWWFQNNLFFLLLMFTPETWGKIPVTPFWPFLVQQREGGLIDGSPAKSQWWHMMTVLHQKEKSYAPWNLHGPWKGMVGIRISFWDALFSGAMFVSGRVPQQSWALLLKHQALLAWHPGCLKTGDFDMLTPWHLKDS